MTNCPDCGKQECDDDCPRYQIRVLLCESESPEPSTYCTLELGHEGLCSWEDKTEQCEGAEREGLVAGLADLRAGRVQPFADIEAELDKK